jgi:small subunit ribosomal protein S21
MAMGIRMRLHDGEPIEQALRRFRQLLVQSGKPWEQRWYFRFVPPGPLRRYKKIRKRFKARLATLRDQKAGKQPVASLAEATAEVWRRRGKP